VLDVPSLQLTPGEYELSVRVQDAGTIVDDVRGAAQFSVVPADVLGSGYHFSANDGAFFFPWSWEIRPSTAGRESSELHNEEVGSR
jgi:hypothetical protein